ncbi:MAG: bifunctional hydroxymethylpyrimidine kinase/phosphomethylpyrimidine kinase, partial [Thermodesulfobacteriota bacterium]
MGKNGIVLSIAGFDPTGGAGVLLDVKIFNLLGLKGAGIPTALTLQNTSVFEGWEPVKPEYLERTLKLVSSDLPVKGIKIGMIGTSENAEIIGNFLKKERNKISWVVLDPVLKATLNYSLFSSHNFIKVLKTKILPFVDVITPNIFEASFLTEKTIRKRKE